MYILTSKLHYASIFRSNYSYEGLKWPREWFLSISGNKHFLPLLVFGDLPAENFFFFSIILLNLYFYRNAQYWWHMKGISVSHIVTATFSIFWNFEFSQTKISMNFFNVLGVENSKCQKIEKVALLLYSMCKIEIPFISLGSKMLLFFYTGTLFQIFSKLLQGEPEKVF